jgi:hypothetical protein
MTELDLYKLPLRTLQKESARALACMSATSDNIYKFNKKAHHNSTNWYVAVIEDYIDLYKGMPSEVGPGKDVKLMLDN